MPDNPSLGESTLADQLPNVIACFAEGSKEHLILLEVASERTRNEAEVTRLRKEVEDIEAVLASLYLPKGAPPKESAQPGSTAEVLNAISEHWKRHNESHYCPADIHDLLTDARDEIVRLHAANTNVAIVAKRMIEKAYF